MVAVTAIIGAVSGTVGTINTIKIWVESLERFVRDFKDSGELLLGLKNNIQECEFRLHLWREFWQLNGASGPYLRELWGSRGTRTIVSQLTTIENLCCKFNDSLDSFFGDTSLAHQVYNTRSTGVLESTSKRLTIFQAYANTIKLNSSNTRIFRFVRTLNSRALEWLALIEPQLTKLESGAVRAYNIRHRQEAKSFLSQEQIDALHAGVLMQMAMEYRDSTEELFRMCFEANIPGQNRNIALAQESIKLKIDLIADPSELELERAASAQDIIERYHILFKREQQLGASVEAELCILRSAVATTQSEISSSALEAYQIALRDSIPAQALCKGSMFCFRPPLEEERLVLSDRPVIPIKDLLKSDSDTFLLQDRIHLAYKIVECGSLLTGTSWLASLKTNHVMRSRSRAGFYYTLDIKPPTPTKRISRGSLLTQILLIGTFLIEIGTGMVLRDFLYGSDGMLLKLEGPEAAINEYSEEEVKRLLTKNNVGDSYAAAALYCFGTEIRRKCRVLAQSQHGAILESYKEVLKDFYLKIYSP